MKRTVNKLENCHVEVLCEFEEQEWKEAQNKAYKKLAQNVTVPGFRKGKAPEHLVRGKIDPMKAMDEAINSLLPSAYEEVLREEKLDAFAQPHVEVTKVSDKELEIKFIVVTAPEVELGKYTGLKIGKEEATVTDEEVKKSIDDLLSQNASLVLTVEEAALGDTVVMDFEGFLDGEPFEGGKGTNYSLELGSHRFIPGFEEVLVGHKAGDSFEFPIKFPEDYQVPELAGKETTFKVTIHEVKEKKVPELNEELIKSLNISGVETVEQLESHQRSEVLKKKEADIKNAYFSKLVEKIIEGSKIAIAPEIIDNQVERSFRDMSKNLEQQYQVKMEDYLKIIGQSEEELRNKLREDATKDAQRFFVLQAIGRKESLEVSEEEFEFELAKLADQVNMKIDDVKKALNQQLNEYRHNIFMRKIQDFLFENND